MRGSVARAATTARTRRAARAARRGAPAAAADPSVRMNSRITGRPKNTSVSTSLYAAARRRLGVVLGEAQAARFADEERVEARHRAGIAKAGIDVRELALPFEQAELREQRVVGQRGPVRLAKRAQHDGGALLEKPILRRRQKARPQHGAERPVAEEQAARAELLVELPLRLGRRARR